MKIFVVDDDEFKRRDMVRVVQSWFRDVRLTSSNSVSHACRAITTGHYDLLILDMSLPTFDISKSGGGGSPQGQGGLEILRVLRRFQRDLAVIVVTQYPDIEYGGRIIALDEAAKFLSENMNVKILDCVLYEYENKRWEGRLRRALGTMELSR